MSQRTLSVAAALVLTLALAACGEESEGPVTTPPPTIGAGSSDGSGGEPSDGGGEGEASDGGGESEGTTDAASSVPAPDPADYPGMDEETPEGAEQAVRFYFASVFWAYSTGDTSVLDDLYAESCEACGGFRERIENQPEGEFWSPVEITDRHMTHLESQNFDLEVGYIFTLGEHFEPTDDGGEPTEYAPTDYTAVLGVDWKDDRWVIEAMSFDEYGNA